MNLPERIFVLLLMSMSIVPSIHLAHAADVTDVTFERVNSNLIVSFTQTHDMLGPGQSTTVEIFGDGRAHVKLPPINPRAGQYELLLNAQELDDLVASIIEGEQAPELAVRSTGLTYISDHTRTNIVVNVQSYVSGSGDVARLSGPIEIREKDLGIRSDAGEAVSTSRVSRLFSVEQQLIQLTTDSRLERI